MEKRKIILLSAIFVVLLILSFYPPVVDRLFRAQKSRLPQNLNLSAVSAEDTKTLTITSANLSLELRQANGSWNVASYSADLEAVNNFFDAVAKSSDFVLVSKSRENQGEYGFGGDGETTLNFKGNYKDINLLIGRSGPHDSSFYVKAPDSDNIYLVSGDAKNFLKTDIDDWREKTATQSSIIINLRG